MTQHANVLPGLVDEMLLDAGLGQEDRLRSALLSLGSLASLPAPAPSGELAALLTESGAGSAGDELGRRRWLRAHRPAVVGLALIAGMGMGAGGVAASSLPHGQPGSASIQHLLKDWAPGWSLPVPQQAESARPAENLPDAGEEAAEPRAAGTDAGEADESQGSSAAGVENPAAARRGAASAEIPPAEIPALHGGSGTTNGQAQTGQDVVEEAGKGSARAAAAAKESVAGPENTAGQGGPGGSDVPGRRVGARVLAEAADEALQATADTTGAALAAVPGNSWLQKFKR
ncbi:MAG: hypothetical protein JWQ56_1073 [Pseudarthrobacter sp.]|nr:hypothetical protein [Pseudarthrobacter sp.]